MKVNCDACKEDFGIKIKTKQVGIYKGNNVRFSYFACSHCKNKYFVGVKEKEFNKLVAKLRRLQKKLGTFIGSGKIDEISRLQSEYDKLKVEIKAYSYMLKDMFALK